MYSPSQVYDRSNSFFSQLITLVAWVGLVACALELYFLIANGRDFLAGWAGIVHYDAAWNKLIQFYGAIFIVCFGIATGIGIKIIAAGLMVLFLLSGFGSTFYLKNHKTAVELPVVQGASVGNSRPAQRPAPQQFRATNGTQRASVGASRQQKWTREAQSKNMKVVRSLSANEIKWCGSEKNLDLRNKINCYTGKVWTFK